MITRRKLLGLFVGVPFMGGLFRRPRTFDVKLGIPVGPGRCKKGQVLSDGEFDLIWEALRSSSVNGRECGIADNEYGWLADKLVESAVVRMPQELANLCGLVYQACDEADVLERRRSKTISCDSTIKRIATQMRRSLEELRKRSPELDNYLNSELSLKRRSVWIL